MGNNNILLLGLVGVGVYFLAKSRIGDSGYSGGYIPSAANTPFTAPILDLPVVPLLNDLGQPISEILHDVHGNPVSSKDVSRYDNPYINAVRKSNLTQSKYVSHINYVDKKADNPKSSIVVTNRFNQPISTGYSSRYNNPYVNHIKYMSIGI